MKKKRLINNLEKKKISVIVTSRFFKNIRKSSYITEERDDQGLTIYRLEELAEQKDYPFLDVSIVHNWRNDNAFVMLQPNINMLSGHSIIIGKDTLSLEQANMTQQVNLAGKIYNQLIDNGSIWLLDNGRTQEFMAKSEDRQAIRVCLFDFFRLTNNF